MIRFLNKFTNAQTYYKKDKWYEYEYDMIQYSSYLRSCVLRIINHIPIIFEQSYQYTMLMAIYVRGKTILEIRSIFETELSDFSAVLIARDTHLRSLIDF